MPKNEEFRLKTFKGDWVEIIKNRANTVATSTFLTIITSLKGLSSKNT